MDFKGRIEETESVIKKAQKKGMEAIVVSSMLGTEAMTKAQQEEFIDHFNGMGYWTFIEAPMIKLPGVFFRIKTNRVK